MTINLMDLIVQGAITAAITNSYTLKDVSRNAEEGINEINERLGEQNQLDDFHVVIQNGDSLPLIINGIGLGTASGVPVIQLHTITVPEFVRQQMPDAPDLAAIFDDVKVQVIDSTEEVQND